MPIIRQRRSAMSELPNQEELNSLAMLVAEWDNNEENIIRTTNVLKMLNARKNTLETDLIPALMATAGNIEEFKLNDGRKITIKEELYASVREAKYRRRHSASSSNGGP